MTPERIGVIVEKIIAAAMHDYGLESHINSVSKDALFNNDLGMDGGDVHTIVIQCEEAFKIQITDNAITEQSCVGDLTEFISDLLIEKETREHD